MQQPLLPKPITTIVMSTPIPTACLALPGTAGHASAGSGRKLPPVTDFLARRDMKM